MTSPTDSSGGSYFFGYSSNMSLAQLTTSRGITPLDPAIPAQLNGWRLVFNVRPILKPMGCLANIWQDPSSSVHGVLYRIKTEQLKQLDMYEGFYQRVALPVTTYDGRTIDAFVYISPLGSPIIGQEGRPSMRLKTILVTEAENHKLALDYRRFLQSIEHENFVYNKDRIRPPRPNRVFTREEVKSNPDLVSFIDCVFDASAVDEVQRRILKRRGDLEFLVVRLMPNPQPVPKTFQEFTPEQVAFLDTHTHAMEVDWPLLGTTAPPTTWEGPVSQQS